MNNITKMTSKRGRPKKSDNEKAKPTDKIVCDICEKIITRSGRTRHTRTAYHQACVKCDNENIAFIKGNSSTNKRMSQLIKKPYINKEGGIEYLTDAQYNFYSKIGSTRHKYSPMGKIRQAQKPVLEDLDQHIED